MAIKIIHNYCIIIYSLSVPHYTFHYQSCSILVGRLSHKQDCPVWVEVEALSHKQDCPVRVEVEGLSHKQDCPVWVEVEGLSHKQDCPVVAEVEAGLVAVEGMKA